MLKEPNKYNQNDVDIYLLKFAFLKAKISI